MFINLLKIGFISLMVLVSGCAKYKPHPLSQPLIIEEDKCATSETVTLNDDLNDIVEMDDEAQRCKGKSKKDLTVVAHVLNRAYA